jgi:hypothetical protein
MNYCPNCGCKLEKSFTLCPRCHQRVKFTGEVGISATTVGVIQGTEIVQCAHCEGSGKIWVDSLHSKLGVCPACGGSGVQRV